MIRCPNCGAQLKYSAKSKLVTCEYCRSKFDPKELKEEVKKAEETKEVYEGKAYLCSQCGAKLLTFDNTAITFCSYCGSQAMVEENMVKQEVPDYIIPFKKTKEECIESYKKVVSKSFFAPKYMKSDIVVNKFRGIYLPYCIYKSSSHGPAYNRGSKYSHRSGDYVYYKDYSIIADIDADYNGISYDLVSNFYDKFSHSIPYNYKEVEDFNPNYLTGFYADKSDVDASIYETKVRQLTKRDSTKYLIKKREFIRHGCYNPTADLRISEKKTAMFPIYFLAIRDKKNTYVNYAVVNGQTGKAAVDLPVDFKKYIFVSILLTIPIFLLLNNFIVLSPIKLCIYSIILSVISLIISVSQAHNIKGRELHLDDIGYSNSTKHPKITISFKDMYKQIIGIILGISLLMINPVDDLFYYASCIVMYVLVIMSFYSLVKQHNELVSTKLPQLGKRGGDERE